MGANIRQVAILNVVESQISCQNYFYQIAKFGEDILNHSRAENFQTTGRFLARDSMLSALYAIANPSVRLSVCLSVTRVDQSKTVELRGMQFSPYSSPIPLVFAW